MSLSYITITYGLDLIRAANPALAENLNLPGINLEGFENALEFLLECDQEDYSYPLIDEKGERYEALWLVTALTGLLEEAPVASYNDPNVEG